MWLYYTLPNKLSLHIKPFICHRTTLSLPDPVGPPWHITVYRKVPMTEGTAVCQLHTSTLVCERSAQRRSAVPVCHLRSSYEDGRTDSRSATLLWDILEYGPRSMTDPNVGQGAIVRHGHQPFLWRLNESKLSPVNGPVLQLHSHTCVRLPPNISRTRWCGEAVSVYPPSL